MIRLKNMADLRGIWRSGQIACALHDEITPLVKPGTSSAELNSFAEQFIAKHGALSAFLHTASVKWTWLFQKPATMVWPEQSITRASGGIWTSPARPTVVMTPADVTMMESEIGVASGEA